MRSIRRTMLVSILGGLLAVLAAAFAAVFLIARSTLRARFDETLIAHTLTFVSLVGEDEFALDPDEHKEETWEEEVLGLLREVELGVLVRVVTSDGGELARSPGWPIDLGPPAELPQPGDEPLLESLRLWSGDDARRAVVASHLPARLRESPADARRLYVETLASTEAVERAEAALLAAMGAGALVAALGAGAVVRLGIRWGLRPVHRLGGELDRIEPGRRTGPGGTYPEELGPIVGAVARLVERIDEAMQRERRFTDAAAHELRTPIAELRTVADVARRWPEPERLTRSVEAARDIAAEMEALIASLLAAARGAVPPGEHGTEAHPLLPIARAALEPRLARLRERGVSVRLEGQERASWTGARGSVLAIVRNLIANACDYTPDGGRIEALVTADDGSTSLEVRNRPTPLTPNDVARLFEPFWRADPSRTDRAHRGLGLAIVAAQCDLLGLAHAAELTADGTLVMTVRSTLRSDSA